MSFTTYQCWQTERISRVIAKAALDIDRATFLATHMPLQHIRYEKSPQALPDTSEQHFLDELDRMATQNQHVFAVVKGMAGTGKSHLIRWLYERYRERHPNDSVILIERASASLKATITQIANSSAFSGDEFADELERLQSASETLSEDGLEKVILNNLHIGTHEQPWHKQLPRRLKPERISQFLLDQTVRDHLRRDDGPIKRIAKFLQDGRTPTDDNLPAFEADDFLFSTSQRRTIAQEGYQGVREIAESISRRTRSTSREELANYLNFLLKEYAISRTINLTSAQLKQMFDDLRRKLRDNGRALALFVEDITAFTGIDKGLIDVLITEHRGESNREFCRLTSVIGITDGYFADHIPDNVRERISHLLTLNHVGSGQAESDMLRDETARLQFAARYLNAIRLEADALHQWEADGAQPHALPNACMSCDYQQTCHAAFGTVDIAPEDSSTAQPIGLYPFNRTALNRLYDWLDDRRTPRSLLNEVIAYILQSHGEKINRGQFPPPQKNLAPRVIMHGFEIPVHNEPVEQQGGDAAESLKTLLTVWGNRTAKRTQHDDQERLADLPQAIFEAFDLPMIQGIEERTTQQEPTPPPSVEVASDEVSDAAANTAKTTSTEAPPNVPRQKSELHDYINAWADDERLYDPDNTLLKNMMNFFRHTIDWQRYAVAPHQLPRNSQASTYFAIEGQSGRIRSSQLVFERSSELQYVLGALADIYDSDVNLSPEAWGEYIPRLHFWIAREEERIALFLRDGIQSAELAASDTTISKLLLQEAILLACLSGDLQPSMSLVEAHEAVTSTATGVDMDTYRKRWQKSYEQKQGSYPDEWVQLMKQLRSQVGIVRNEALQQFNSVLGASTAVQFLNAAEIYQILHDFWQSEWELTTLPQQLQTSSSNRYKDALSTHEKLQADFWQAIEAASRQLTMRAQEIETFLDGATPTAVRKQALALLQDMSHIHRVDVDLRENLANLDTNRLNHALEEMNDLQTCHNRVDRALFVSGRYHELYTILHEAKLLFQMLQDELVQAQQQFTAKTSESQDSQEADQIVEDIHHLYAELLDRLSEVLQQPTEDL